METIRFLNDYTIRDLIHESDRTLVYRGVTKADGQPVVLKLMRNNFPSFNELVQFRNQYTIARNVQIEGIVKPLALERYRNGYALVMPDFGGISLDKNYQKLLHNQNPISHFLAIAVKITEILDRLHQNRIIHKDIKPANILINAETKQVKIIDFSISTLLPKETQTIQTPNVLEGTLAYISPEQTGRMNRGIDYRSDFYSLGVMFFEMLNGVLPFDTTEPMELIHDHLATMPIFGKNEVGRTTNEEGTQIPQMLIEIVLKLMAKNAEDRYQSASGLKYDLEKCQEEWQENREIEYFELGERDISDRFLIPEKLYGREAETQQLLGAFERVAEGTTELMLVAGFSGIGKTAVVNEVHKPIVREKGYFIKGKFDQFNRNIPFSALVQSLRDLMGQILSESDTQLQQWKNKILDAVGENGQIIIDVIPELEKIIGKQPAVPALSGSIAENRFNFVFGKFLQVFAKKEHPLVIFLDDLQWADSASLNLMKILMSEASNSYLLTLGAYRDNEVFPAHPLMLTLDEMGKAEATINTITLAPLSEENINHLVADTLSCDEEVAKPLTELVYQKTNGNPFFTTQFLLGLHEDKLISFNNDVGHWECDISEVRQRALTNDVVEFMAGRLQKLPEETQNVLKLAACIGNRFDLETLAIVCEKSKENTADSLWKALQDGFILPESEVYKFFQENTVQKSVPSDLEEKNLANILVSYRFLHDRVQQAAYVLIDETQKQSVHLTIGKRLLAHQSVTGSDENIFNILNHVMVGINADPKAISAMQLAELAFSAGMKAKLSIAYQAAITYFDFGLSRLPLNSWLDCYQLKLDLSREKAECHYFLGHFEKSEELLDRILLKVKNPLDKARVYGILMTQRATQGTDFLSSLEAGIKGLAVLGMELSTDSAQLSYLAEQEHQQVLDFFQTNSPKILLELPEMSDRVQQSCMKLLSILSSVAYLAGNKILYWFITLRMMNSSLRYGRAESSSFSFSVYALILAYRGQYQTAYEFGRVSLDVDRKFNNKQFIAKNNNHFGHGVNPYVRPLKENLPLYRQSFENCIEFGDLLFGVWAIDFLIWTHIIKGSELYYINDEIQKYIGYVRDVNDINMLHAFELKQKLIQELIDESVADEVLTLEGFLKNTVIVDWREKNYEHGINWYGFLVLKRLYLKERYAEVVQVARSLKPTIPANIGFFPVFIYYTYYPLSITAIFRELDKNAQETDLKELKKLQDTLYNWANICPYNFLHKYQLISAEIHCINGDFLKAIELYDRAIASAKENEYIQDEALANELAAKFYLEWGKDKIASVYMTDAYYCYARWGAKAKIEDLEKRYPDLLRPILEQAAQTLEPLETLSTLNQDSIASTHSSTSSLNSTLDLATVLKASQAISGIIELDELLRQLTQIILQHSGGDRCALMLPNRNGKWYVQAIATPEETAICCQPLENHPNLPTELIQYVKNTQEIVVVNDFKTDLPIIDRYLLQKTPKSLLCLPILNQGHLIGILYLKNLLVSGAFTKERVMVLNFLCTQAAISLENARLYEQSQAYARELEQSQLQIVQYEKMASLGNLMAGVAHEINNPLGFLNGSIGNLQENLQDIMEHFQLYPKYYPEPVNAIEENAEEIDLDYLCEDMPKLLKSMENATERIKNISTSLRTFSRSDTEHKVSADIHQGIDSTLMILKYRLKANQQRPGIEVIKDYGEFSEVECFPGQLNQVFMNIIANGIDVFDEVARDLSYSDLEAQPQRITIKTALRTKKNVVTIAIADNGTGMPPEVKERIFDHLFTTKCVGKGTGLGLAIVRQIVVEKHGGTIDCISELGKGTKFIITLPLS